MRYFEQTRDFRAIYKLLLIVTQPEIMHLFFRKSTINILHSIVLYMFLLNNSPANAQDTKQLPDVYFSIGYQYANFGNSLSNNQISMFTTNQLVAEGGNKATNYQHAYGLVLRLAIAPGGDTDSPFRIEMALTNKKVLSDQEYETTLPDIGPTLINTRYKTRIRALSIGTAYHLGPFALGGSVDIGMFSSLRKFKGIGGEDDGKWVPWFSTPKVFGSGYSGKTPIVGATLHASWFIGQRVELRLYKQFSLGLAAELSDRYFSLGNVGIELNLILPNSK